MKTNIEKAYDRTMKVIANIKEQGIGTEIVVPRRVKENKCHDTVERYHPPERLPIEKWRHVTLIPKTKEQSDFIYKQVKKLRKFGIGFDTGGGCDGNRDWEIDWSFRCKKEKKVESLKSLQENEELIRELF